MSAPVVGRTGQVLRPSPEDFEGRPSTSPTGGQLARVLLSTPLRAGHICRQGARQAPPETG